ncbi:MAG: energy transducer TonB [Bacteroidota bacterium]
MTPQLRMGWYGSILLHLLLLLVALLMFLPQAVRRSDFVEMDWGALPAARVASDPAPTPATPPMTVKRAPAVKRTPATSARAQKRVELPERRLPDLSDDALSVPRRTEKMDIAGPDVTPQRSERSGSERQDPIGTREQVFPGRAAEKPGPSVTGTGAGEGVSRPGTGGAGSGVGYDVQWTGGGSRRKLSGNLPKYPEGTNVAAQVRIRASVLPDGSVRSVQPTQKANTALEDAAMKELKLWRFEPLPAAVPQVEQDCVVSFSFRLR